jgi:hypothetical protein
MKNGHNRHPQGEGKQSSQSSQRLIVPGGVERILPRSSPR